MASPPLLSVILPVFNEEEAISSVLQELSDTLDNAFQGAWEVIVVDDGSTDQTTELLKEYVSIQPRVRLIILNENFGQSTAVWTGLNQASSEWVATMDSDGQNDPADLVKLFAEKEEADAVFGYRADRKDPRAKRWGGRLANWVRNATLGEQIRDSGCSLKMFKKELLQPLFPWKGMHRFWGSLFLMQGARIHQLPVHHRPRSAGTSKYTNWGRFTQTWADLIAVRWLRSRYALQEVPLREPDKRDFD